MYPAETLKYQEAVPTPGRPPQMGTEARPPRAGRGEAPRAHDRVSQGSTLCEHDVNGGRHGRGNRSFMTGELSSEQRFALIFETETTSSLIRGGLRALATRSASNDEPHLPLHLLSQGLERLLKLTWALCTFERTGLLPSGKEVKRVGHDLLSLETEVPTLARSCDKCCHRPLITEEDKFIANDAVLRATIEALSNFARAARYRDLDLLLDPRRAAEIPDVRKQWSQVESLVLALHPEWTVRLAEPSFTGWYAVLAQEFLTRLHRYVRFVSFMWTLGPLGTSGRRHSVPLTHFILLRYDEMGEPPPLA